MKRTKVSRGAAVAGMLAAQAAPVAVIEGHGRETSADRYRKFLADEAAAERAKLDALTAPLRENATKLAKAQCLLIQQVWSKPIDPETVNRLRVDENAVDSGLDVSEGKCSGETAKAACVAWSDELTPNAGYTLSEKGMSRLIAYSVVQLLAGKDMSTTSAWQAAFDRLLYCQAFAEGEISRDESLITTPLPEPEAEPVKQSLDEILDSVSLESRSGRQKAIDAVHEEMFEVEAKGMWAAWTESMRMNFGGFCMTEPQQKAAYNFFTTRGLNWMLHKNYDDCRVYLVKTGVFEPTMLTPDEKAAMEVEAAPPLSTMSYEDRQTLKRKLASLCPEPIEAE